MIEATPSDAYELTHAIDMTNKATVRELYLVCQGLQVDKGDGIGNVVATAQLLYDALYHKDTVVEIHEVAQDPRFPETLPLIRRPLAETPAHIPSRVEFIERIRDVITREIDHESVLYPGASDVVREMMSDGAPVAIWTNGDHGDGEDVQPITESSKNYSDSQRPGSFEQLKKIVGGGFARIRREAALARLATTEELLTPEVLEGTLTSFVGTDKFEPDMLDNMADYFSSRAISEIVVLEDRVKNLVRLKELMAGRNIIVHGIVVRQGRHGLANDSPKGMSTVNNLEEARQLIHDTYKTQDVRLGFVSDFDGVLSNQGQRRELQANMVAEVLSYEQWV